MKPSVLLVEDDANLCIEFVTYLCDEGFDARSVGTFSEAEAALASPPDILVVDINLPDGSGLDLCREKSIHRRMGIVMCTARDERDLRIRSLKEGADAYLVKPVDPEELEATLLSVYRRISILESSHPWASFTSSVNLQRPWRLDSVERVLVAPTGVAIFLTANENQILKALFTTEEQRLSREQLAILLDGVFYPGSMHRLEMLVSRLRRKVIDKAGVRLPLVSAYGRGYEFTGRGLCDEK